MTKLKIDILNGVLEVEGEETFVVKIYDDFKDKLNLSDNPVTKKEKVDATTTPNHGVNTTTTPASNHKVAKAAKENYSIVKELDLSGKNVGKSLKNFYNEKSPFSFGDKNVVFVYYLKKIAKIPNVTLGHIFTCYDEVGSRKPNAFKQSIADTSSKKGWLNTSSFENIDVSIRGQNQVEHELPPKKTKKVAE
jgi:hypothetical protein